VSYFDDFDDDDEDRAERRRAMPWTSVAAFDLVKSSGTQTVHATHVMRVFARRLNAALGTEEIALELGNKPNAKGLLVGGVIDEVQVNRSMTFLRKIKALEWHGQAFKNVRGNWCKRSRIKMEEPATFELELEEVEPPAAKKIVPTLVVDNERPERAQRDPNRRALERQVELLGWDGARVKWIRDAKAALRRLEARLEKLERRAERMNIDGQPLGAAVIAVEERRIVATIAVLSRSLIAWNNEIGKEPTR
jgi:hypothetical protein